MDRSESICTTRSVNNDDNGTNNNNNHYYFEDKNGLGMQWTNERHSNFLRLMEASFVRNMVGRSSSTSSSTTTTTNNNNNNNNNNNITTTATTTSAQPVVNSRLDRFVPDISESTLDLHRSANSTDRVTRTCNRQKERAIIRPYNLSHDQVVPQPQLEDKAGDKGV